MFANPHQIFPDRSIGMTSLVIADTMATKYNSLLPIITPANTRAENSGQISRIRLVRKLYLLGDHCMAAFAGPGDRISACLNDIDGARPVWTAREEPVGGLMEIASKYPEVQICGIMTNPVGSSWFTNGRSVESKNLGPCGLIGSGTENLIEQIRDFDASRERMPYSNPYSISHEFALTANATCIMSEIAGRKETWGGYFEYALTKPDGKWAYGGKVLHLVFRIEQLEGNCVTMHAIPKFVAYDAGGHDGRIFTGSQSSGGHVLRDFLIENLLNPSIPEYIPSAPDLWKEWMPEVVSLSVFVPNSILGSGIVTQHIGFKELKNGGLSFWVSGNQADARLSTEEFHRFGEGIANTLGLGYVAAVGVKADDLKPY